MDTFEKKYKNALTIAQSRFKIEKDESVLTCLGMMFPELRESEEERMIKWVIKVLDEGYKAFFEMDYSKEDVLSWLEKQKESLHIPETCKENEKSEKPINQDELEKEIEAQLSIFPYTKVSPELPESRWLVIRKELSMFARHFAQWGAEHLKK